jgi:putative ABC transport system permease protein
MSGLLMRWSWRDLRRRWRLVATIALVIGLGTGTYAALLSTSEWRRQSNDASFAAAGTHDLRVRLAQGSTVGEGTLADLVRRIPHAREVRAARERLVLPTQVAVPDGVLASGELVGSATGPGDVVDAVSRAAGRSINDADDGAPVVVLERSFAERNGLPDRGELTLSGGERVEYAGLGQSPEYFLVSGGQGALPFLSQKSYATVFSTLHTAQRLANANGQVNDIVLVLRDAATAAVVGQEIQQAVAGLRPQVSAEITTKSQLDSYRVLYDDIAGDERLWRVIALLVLTGAAFAALNLTTRVVEAQRREIGIGMALGVPDRVLALRPLLFGAQVALIGVVLGVLVGWLIGIPLRGVFTSMIPLPIWRTPFQPGVFTQAAVLGFVLPFAAVAWPVWRAVRVQPVRAIRVGHLAAGDSSRSRVLGRVPLPGRSYQQVPVRNLVRTPRRTLLTTLGIAAAITTLVTTTGFLDTFNGALDRSERELLRMAPDRVAVSLRDFQPTTGSVVAAVSNLPEVEAASTGLLIPATAVNGSRSIELITETLGPDAPWTPTIASGTSTSTSTSTGGIVLAQKAATDLNVRIGDTITMTHPQAVPAGGMRSAQTRLRVVGLHPSPTRVLAYLDEDTAAIFGLSSATNLLTVTPAPGTSTDDVRRALLSVPEVAAAEASATTMESMRSGLAEFLGILRVAAAVTLLLALLIAVNTASIGMDERTREHATMLAFGLPVHTVLLMTTVESLLIGAAGSVLGIAGGYGMLVWLTATTIPVVLPEIGVTAAVNAATMLAALLLGMATVAAAPLLTLRRLQRTDIPSTLRVVE